MAVLPLILIVTALIIISVLQIIYPEKVMLFGVRWLFKGKVDVVTSMKTLARIRGSMGAVLFSGILIKILMTLHFD